MFKVILKAIDTNLIVSALNVEQVNEILNTKYELFEVSHVEWYDEKIKEWVKVGWIEKIKLDVIDNV